VLGTGALGSEVSAAMLPCAGCHGRDGRGRPEGGVAPSDLTWDVLSRPYGVTRREGRSHPAYDARSLKRAITLGVDAGGNPLQAAMPRYRLDQAQAAALVAYIQTLGREIDPGVTPGSLRLGVVLPPPPADAAVRRALDSMAARIAGAGAGGGSGGGNGGGNGNGSGGGNGGGLYGRRLDLRYLAAPAAGAWAGDAGADFRAAVERFVAAEQPFALVASHVVGGEAVLAELTADLDLPIVGALTPEPRTGPPLARWVFYLQPGLAEQARALVESVADGVGGVARHPGLLVAVGQAATLGSAAADELARTGLAGWTATYGAADRDLAARIVAARDAGVDALILLGGEDDARNFLAGAATLDWHPRVYLLAALAAGAVLDAPPAFAGRLFLAAPSLPRDLTPSGEDLLRQAGLDAPAAGAAGAPAPASPDGAAAPHATVYERQAVAAFEVLVEALTRCGRELSRDRLVDAVEGLHAFDTGLTPRLTFGPERHLGAFGAYIVAYDPSRGGLVPAGGWVTPR
jgi:ABC-type branched-subunit amino acid transport system substrate-binding protein